jgi:hypothetical protein
MESVGSTKLKTRLNSYLRQVQKGVGFIISSDPDEIVASLVSKGLIDLDDISGQINLQERSVTPIRISGVSASQILLEDRE